jgi:predicted DNA-binding protein
MLTIDLAPDVQQRLAACARARGVSDADMLRALIEEGLDDLEDTRLAHDRLSHPMPAIPSDQARRALGLED